MRTSLLFIFSIAFAGNLQAQTATSQFIDPTGEYSTYASGLCLGCNIVNADEVSDNSLTTAATINIVGGIAYSRTLRAKLNALEPAFTNAGFYVTTASLVSALPTVTITTYKAGLYRETLLSNGNMLTILNATTSFVCGASNTTLDYDEVGITFNAGLTTVAMQANVYYAFGGAAYCAVVLPNTFESFSINAQKGYPVLQWSASDNGNGVYEVERSANAKDFTKTAVMISDETSGQKNFSYTDFDNAQDSVTYYRIGMKPNPEATELFTKIVSVTSAVALHKKEMIIFPNPVERTVSIRMPKSSTSYSMEILDLQGSLVERQIITGDEGSTMVAMTLLHDLRPGLYILKVKGNADTDEYRTRFVKR